MIRRFFRRAHLLSYLIEIERRRYHNNQAAMQTILSIKTTSQSRAPHEAIRQPFDIFAAFQLIVYILFFRVYF